MFANDYLTLEGITFHRKWYTDVDASMLWVVTTRDGTVTTQHMSLSTVESLVVSTFWKDRLSEEFFEWVPDQ